MLGRTFLCLALFFAPVATAGPVVLTAIDGGMRVEGELLDFDGELFRIRTAYGELTMDGGNFRCQGTGCPEPASLVARLKIGGPPAMIHELMPALLEVFAEREGLGLRCLSRARPSKRRCVRS